MRIFIVFVDGRPDIISPGKLPNAPTRLSLERYCVNKDFIHLKATIPLPGGFPALFTIGDILRIDIYMPYSLLRIDPVL